MKSGRNSYGVQTVDVLGTRTQLNGSSSFSGEFNVVLVAPSSSAEGRNLAAGMERWPAYTLARISVRHQDFPHEPEMVFHWPTQGNYLSIYGVQKLKCDDFWIP